MTDGVTDKRRRDLIKTMAGGGAVLLAGCSSGGSDDGSGDSGGDSSGDSGGDSGGGGGDTDGDSGDGGGESLSMTYVYPGYFSNDAQSLVPMFEEQAESITVESQQTPSDASSTREYYVNQFVSGSSSFDVGNMDVIWPAEFAGNGWAAEVSDPEGHTENMLQTPIDSVTVDGTMYGMPIHTDANALYYRTDLLEEYGYDSPPTTFMELVEIAQDIKSQSDQNLNGYIWQGGSNEGLTIMWLNWFWGMGGELRQDGDLVVNSQEGIDALQHAVDLIHEYEVTPESIPASATDQNRQTFQQGNTIFMRNWPYAVAIMNEDGSPVQGNFDVAPMPKAEGHQDANNSCLGGWNLFINANSENKDAAQEFASYMASMEAQETMALEHSRLPVRQELYTDEYYEQASQLETFAQIVDQTSARPATPQYSTFSEIVYTNCNAALVQNKTPEEALNDAQEEIDSEVNNA